MFGALMIAIGISAFPKARKVSRREHRTRSLARTGTRSRHEKIE